MPYGALRFLLDVVATGTAMWIVAGVWHNVIMARLYDHVHAAHDGIGLLYVAYLILAAFMTFLYPMWPWTGHPISGGLVFGAVIGLLWVFPHGLAMAGAHNTSVAYVIKNSAWHMVEQGIGGIVLALVHGSRILAAGA